MAKNRIGLKFRINLAIAAVMLVASGCIVIFSYMKSSAELSAAVERGNLSVAHATASDIFNLNDREFKMLEALGNLSVIRDAEVDMHDKWLLIGSATGGSKKYLGMAIYNERGVGWTTTEKWSDLSSREYLKVSMQGRNAIMDPNWSPVNGNLSTFYAHPFYDGSNRQIGEVVAVLDSTDLCRTVAKIQVGKNSHPFVVNAKTGKYVANADVEIVKAEKNIADGASEGFKGVISRILSGETGTAVFYDEIAKAKYSVAFQPIPECDWSVVCMAPYSDFYGGIGELLRSMVFIAIVSILLSLVVGFVVVHFAISPLNRVIKAIEGISRGDADLTARIRMASNDEIGKLAKGFNGFSEKLHRIVSELKGSKEDLRGFGELLGKMVQENANFLSEMINSIDGMNEEIRNQHEKVGTSVQAVDNISKSVEMLREQLRQQTEGVEQASAAVTEMIGNIDSVSGSVEKMVGEFNLLKVDVDGGIAQQHAVSEQIQQIEQQSKMLNEANKVISSIASQTNLLAMNAAIEAAHAGESGKGFAVVSDEIRKLSESSAQESKKINAQLKGILSSIKNVVQSSDLSDRSFSAVVEKLDQTDTLVRQIKLAMEEQSQGSKQIGDALRFMNDATSNVRSASEGVDSARQGIIRDVTSLKNSSDSVQEKILTLEENIQKIKEDDSELLGIATSINGSIYRIGTQVDQFKI